MKKVPQRDPRKYALQLLTRREHTRAELASKLAAHGTQEEIETLLNDLARSGLQSDARFAESYVRSQAGRQGAARLRLSLRQKGVDDELASQLIGTLPDELDRCRALWTRKFDGPPADARAWAKQARFLQTRGFSVEIIRRLLKEQGESDA